jgi:hypothetical protein
VPKISWQCHCLIRWFSHCLLIQRLTDLCHRPPHHDVMIWNWSIMLDVILKANSGSFMLKLQLTIWSQMNSGVFQIAPPHGILEDQCSSGLKVDFGWLESKVPATILPYLCVYPSPHTPC